MFSRSRIRQPRPRRAVARAALLETLESRRLLATVSWINSAGGDFNNPANWDTNTVPTTGDDAVIALAGTYQVTLTSGTSQPVNSLTLGGASGAETLTISAGSTLDL